MTSREQDAIEFAFQSLNPGAQSRLTSNPKAYEQVNVVGHEHIASNANTKVSGAAAVFDEGGMYLRCREQAGPNMGVERYEIDRRVEALEDQMQSWRLTFERALHSECCSVRRPRRTRSRQCRVKNNPLRTADATARRG